MYADENRIEAVISSVKRRISNLQALAVEKAGVIDNIEDDVMENIAADYVHDDVSFLSDSLVGVLSSDADEKKARQTTL